MLRLALLLAGIGIGLWHLKLGARAGFVARNDEPLSFWIALLTGPFSTLPASITSFFRPVIGGTWLCCGALICYVAAMTALGPKGNLDDSLWTFIRYSAPMLALGVAAFIMARLSKTGYFSVDKKTILFLPFLKGKTESEA